MDDRMRAIFLDLSAAPNETHHVVLLTDIFLELFSHQMWSSLVYLIGRYFNSRHVHYGAAQGSCPGPLRFSISASAYGAGVTFSANDAALYIPALTATELTVGDSASVRVARYKNFQAWIKKKKKKVFTSCTVENVEMKQLMKFMKKT